MDLFLYSYFTENIRKEKAQEFEDFILSDMSFERKLILLKKLKLEKRKTTTFNPDLFYKKVDFIRRYRHISAHNLYSISPEKKIIFNNGKEETIIDENIMKEFTEAVAYLIIELVALFKSF